jgi:hypothetical protein
MLVRRVSIYAAPRAFVVSKRVVSPTRNMPKTLHPARFAAFW